MTAARTPRIRRAVERALLARDRMEIAAAEKLLKLLRVERRRRARAARRRPGRAH